MKLLIKKMREGAVIPQRATAESAGYDLCACLEESKLIYPKEIVKIPTGIAAQIEGDENCVLLIYARSSTATKKGLAPVNCVGVVDKDYRGEIIVPLINQSSELTSIAPGERIAQLVITPVFLPEVKEVSELSETERGTGGFGSTNK